MTPGAVAVRAGAFRVGAEQGGLDAVGFCECLADRLEQPGVGRRDCCAANPVSASGRPTAHPHVRTTEPCSSELFPDPATPVTTTRTPSGMSTSTSCKLWALAPADLECPGRLSHRLLQRGPIVQMATRDGLAAAQPGDGALEADGAAGRAGARAEIDDVIGDRRSSPACARRRAPCFPCPAGESADRSCAGCRADAGPWSARRRRT